MVCAINPSIDAHTDSLELLQLQQVNYLKNNMHIYIIQNLKYQKVGFYKLILRKYTYSVFNGLSCCGTLSFSTS